MDFSQFLAPEVKKERKKKETSDLSTASKTKNPDYSLTIKRQEDWQGVRYILKVTHLLDKHVEAVAKCKEENLEKSKEKMYKTYKRLGKVIIIEENDDKGNDRPD